jgi:hypothetical protein
MEWTDEELETLEDLLPAFGWGIEEREHSRRTKEVAVGTISYAGGAPLVTICVTKGSTQRWYPSVTLGENDSLTAFKHICYSSLENFVEDLHSLSVRRYEYILKHLQGLLHLRMAALEHNFDPPLAKIEVLQVLGSLLDN